MEVSRYIYEMQFIATHDIYYVVPDGPQFESSRVWPEKAVAFSALTLHYQLCCKFSMISPGKGLQGTNGRSSAPRTNVLTVTKR